VDGANHRLCRHLERHVLDAATKLDGPGIEAERGEWRHVQDRGPGYHRAPHDRHLIRVVDHQVELIGGKRRKPIAASVADQELVNCLDDPDAQVNRRRPPDLRLRSLDE
jgi:hypothetical protein